MRILAMAAVAAFVLAPRSGFAQEDIDSEIEAALASEKKEPAAGKDTTAEPLPEIGEDQLAVFELERGFYCSGDMGIFLTFGGTRGYSNVQPYVSLKAGFDINDFLGVQLSLAGGYSSGNPLSDNDGPLSPLPGQQVVDYSLFNMGLEVVGALRPTPRFAIEPKVGGGMTRIAPTPHDPNDPAVFVSGFVPHVAAGVDFKYLTLLTDFTAGVSLTGYYIIGPNIPALGAGFVVRYTF